MSGSTERAGVVQPALVVPHRGMLLTLIVVAMAMQMLDTTIANVALPHMQASLLATQDTVTWVLTSYVLATAVALPLSGWLVDTFGIKRLMVASVIMFTAASALCGAAQNLEQMVFFRILQGLAGAFLQPIAQTVMLDVSTPAERPKVMTLFSQTMMIAPIAGPLLGGYLTENFNWRWVFYVNVPIGIACAFGLLAVMPKTATFSRKFDVRGWLFVAVAVAALQLMLDRGSSEDWFHSFEIVSYLVISVCATWVALVHLATTDHPIFPLRLFADVNFTVGLVITFVVGVISLASMALLPQMLQTILGYPVIDAGYLLAPRGVGMLLSMSLFGRLIHRFDPRLFLAIGLAMQAWTMWLMTGWSTVMPAFQIVWTGMLQGIAMSMIFVPLNLIMYATLPSDLRTDASGLASLFRNIGSSIGISICTVLLLASIQTNHEEIAQRVVPIQLPFNLGQMADNGTTQMGMRIIDGLINREAAMIGYINDFLLMSVICVLTIPLLFLMQRPSFENALPEDAIPDFGH